MGSFGEFLTGDEDHPIISYIIYLLINIAAYGVLDFEFIAKSRPFENISELMELAIPLGILMKLFMIITVTIAVYELIDNSYGCLTFFFSLFKAVFGAAICGMVVAGASTLVISVVSNLITGEPVSTVLIVVAGIVGLIVFGFSGYVYFMTIKSCFKAQPILCLILMIGLNVAGIYLAFQQAALPISTISALL